MAEGLGGGVPVYGALQGAVAAVCGGAVVCRKERVAGGDINDAFALTLSTGGRIFMKASAHRGGDFFAAEVLGLRAIAQTGAVSTPRVLCTGTDAGGFSFLLMEYVAGAARQDGYWRTFARELAAMHAADASAFTGGRGLFGFGADNFIGAREQVNTPCSSWVQFFRDARLAPQALAARQYFSAQEKKRMDWLLDHLDLFLAEPKRPSLVHGDLWSGNVLCGPDGKAWLIDPAAYVGDAEVDIAMTQLFGGFPAEFYDAYRETHPLEPGYAERRGLYNLYHLLNHLNMFGAGYHDAVTAIVSHYAG